MPRANRARDQSRLTIFVSGARSLALGGALCVGVVGAAAGQTPDILRERPVASVAALGGAAVAAVGLFDARSINPSLLAGNVNVSFSGGFYREEATDVSGARGGLTGSFGHVGIFSVDVRRRQVENLLEDSVLAGDPNLEVSDWGIRVGYARGFAGNRLRVGATWEGLSSRVFGTTGGGWTLDIGAAAVLTSRASVGIAVARLGPEYKWRDALGGTMYSPQGRTITGGVRWSAGTGRRVSMQLGGDVVRALETAAEPGVRFGAEVTLLQRVSLRGGHARMGGRGGTRTSAAGLGIKLGNARIDVARDRLGSVVGERTLLDFSLER